MGSEIVIDIYKVEFQVLIKPAKDGNIEKKRGKSL